MPRPHATFTRAPHRITPRAAANLTVLPENWSGSCCEIRAGEKPNMPRATIVVVEDEQEVLSVLRDILEDEGYEVVAIPHPLDVPEQIAGIQPSLFLIDIMLPKTSGIELAHVLQHIGYASPIIAMSASRVMTRVASQSGVFTDVVDKPFDIEKLLECIERYIKDRTEQSDQGA